MATGRLIDMAGQRIGAWLVLEHAGFDRHKQAWWLCRCDCGTEAKVTGGRLRRGDSKSCGCTRSEKSRAANTKHGDSARGHLTPEYRVWSNIIFRCENPSGKAWQDYGGRGITVCDRWRHDFAAFLADMGRRPTPKHEIDRINVNGHYEPTNCRWVTRTVNARNKRSNRVLEADGRSMLLVDWAEELGVHSSVILGRLSLGWPVERAVTEPPRRSRRAA